MTFGFYDVSSSQTYLLKPADDKRHQLHPIGGGGPVFDFGPGWGARLGKWWRKNGSKKVLPPIAVLALMFGLVLTFSNRDKNERAADELQVATIGQAILRGDSYTHVARRTIAEYLKSHSTVELTPGQRVFIEEHLWRKVTDQPLVADAEIEFAIADIESLISQAKSLSPATLQKWEEYAKRVRF